jgi:hypothetical protein
MWWYVDTTIYCHYSIPKNATQTAMYWILDTGVGGDWAGAPVASELPTEHSIDAVRVFGTLSSPPTRRLKGDDVGGSEHSGPLFVPPSTHEKTPQAPTAPPGGFTNYSWETVQTFCFPGETGTAGYSGHPGNERRFTAAQIELYTKFDLVMIAMLNQTALHPRRPRDGRFVPQATAMSIRQAEAIKVVRPDVPVFAYITGFLAQSTFEGGAKFARPDYSDWWLRDTNGAFVDNNYSKAHPTNCDCFDFTQDAPGPQWDFRQERVRHFFMDEMVSPMISSPSINGIFFDDAINIPNDCLQPPHGNPRNCHGSFTFTAAEQAASGAATLQHFDTVLGAMAQRDKGTAMSMNPVTADSYPINSSQGDGMLLKHKAFRFWEVFGRDDIVTDIELALELGSKGHPFLAHFGSVSNDWSKRKYWFATYLIVASQWTYYGMSAGWGARSFPWYPEYDKPLGRPSGPAQRVAPGRYFRDFEHLNVSLDTTARTASVIWKGSIPQPPPSPPAVDCTPWRCTCQGMTDVYGTVAHVGFGCAPSVAQAFWRRKRCDTARPLPCSDPPATGCENKNHTGTTHSGSCCPACKSDDDTLSAPCDHRLGGLRRWGVNHHTKKTPLPGEAAQIAAAASIARVGINWDKVSSYEPPAPPHCTDEMPACYEINYTNTHPFIPACPNCSSGPLQFAGTVGTMGECESLCLHRGNCTSWTWRNGDGSPWAHHCWARSDGQWMPVPNRNDITGRMNRTTLHTSLQQLQYNFSSYDDLLAAQQAVGVDAYWILSCGGSGSSCRDGLAPTTDVQRTDFATFAVETMAHFAGQGIVWELWNEWIGTSEGAGTASYAALLNVVGAAVRSDPRTKTEILVGPASSGVNEGFVQELVKADAVRWLDAVSVHPYRSEGPESVLADYARIIGSSLPIISGEWGWAACADAHGAACVCHGGGGSGMAVSDEEQGWLLARQWLVNDLGGVPISIWYDFKDGGTDRTNGEDNYGLVRSEYANSSLAHVTKPAFHAAQTLQRLFGAQTFSQREISADHRATFALRYLPATSDEGPSVSNSSSKQSSWALGSANLTGVTGNLDFLDGCRDIYDTFGSQLGEVCPGDGAAKAWNYTADPRYLVPKLQIDGRKLSPLPDTAWKTDGRSAFADPPLKTDEPPAVVVATCSGADCTSSLQHALDSGASTVHVPNIGRPWVVAPTNGSECAIRPHSNQKIVLGHGVELLAKKGSFHGGSDHEANLLCIGNVHNVTVKGMPGATLRMHRADYGDSSKYHHSEDRHGIDISNAQNVLIEDLHITSTGGDCIQMYPSTNIHIKNCVLDRGYRYVDHWPDQSQLAFTYANWLD